MKNKLTQKQKDNRKYYAKHAERIKAQKRAHAKKNKIQNVKHSKLHKPLHDKQVFVVNFCRKPWEEVDPDKYQQTEEARKQVALRHKIEDWHLAKDLGIDNF